MYPKVGASWVRVNLTRVHLPPIPPPRVRRGWVPSGGNPLGAFANTHFNTFLSKLKTMVKMFKTNCGEMTKNQKMSFPEMLLNIEKRAFFQNWSLKSNSTRH